MMSRFPWATSEEPTVVEGRGASPEPALEEVRDVWLGVGPVDLFGEALEEEPEPAPLATTTTTTTTTISPAVVESSRTPAALLLEEFDVEPEPEWLESLSSASETVTTTATTAPAPSTEFMGLDWFDVVRDVVSEEIEAAQASETREEEEQQVAQALEPREEEEQEEEVRRDDDDATPSSLSDTIATAFTSISPPTSSASPPSASSSPEGRRTASASSSASTRCRRHPLSKIAEDEESDEILPSRIILSDVPEYVRDADDFRLLESWVARLPDLDALSTNPRSDMRFVPTPFQEAETEFASATANTRWEPWSGIHVETCGTGQRSRKVAPTPRRSQRLELDEVEQHAPSRISALLRVFPGTDWTLGRRREPSSKKFVAQKIIAENVPQEVCGLSCSRDI